MPNAVVVWSLLPSANDNVDGSIPAADITCQDSLGNVVMSGDRYPVGTTTVTCRANDTAQNEGSTVFTITVVGTYILHVLTEQNISKTKLCMVKRITKHYLRQWRN